MHKLSVKTQANSGWKATPVVHVGLRRVESQLQDLVIGRSISSLHETNSEFTVENWWLGDIRLAFRGLAYEANC